MANPSFSTGFRNAILDGTDLQNMFDSGFLDIYTGAPPADADAAETGTKLAECALGTTTFDDASSGGTRSASAGGLPWQELLAVNNGAAGWFRLYDLNHTLGASSTAIRIDGDITVTGGGGDITIDNVTIGTNDVVNITAFSISISI